MRVTVQHTLDIEDVPEYIEDRLRSLSLLLEELRNGVEIATQESQAERYIASSELLDEIRQKMSFLDSSKEEIQSISLSYEKIRIQRNMPESTPASAPSNE